VKRLRWILAGIVCCTLLFTSVGVAFAQEETPEPVTTEEPILTPQNPVAAFIAEVTGSTYEEIIALQQAGYGMGNISKAYFYLQQLEESGETGETGEVITMTLEDVLAQAHSMGWGNLWKEAGLGPGVGHGVGWLFKHGTDDETTDETETTESDNTQGHHGKPDWAGGNHNNNGNNGNNGNGHH
jgi:hypothetical protein